MDSLRIQFIPNDKYCLGFPNRVVVCIPIGCCAPDPKHNDCELTFACFSVLRPEIQTSPPIERYGHGCAPGSTALFSTIGPLRAPPLPPMAVKSKPPAVRVVVDSVNQFFGFFSGRSGIGSIGIPTDFFDKILGDRSTAGHDLNPVANAGLF